MWRYSSSAKVARRVGTRITTQKQRTYRPREDQERGKQQKGIRQHSLPQNPHSEVKLRLTA